MIDALQNTFDELVQHRELHDDDHADRIIANVLPTKGTLSKWTKVLSDVSAPAFVPVKHYSVTELLRLRAHASTHVKFDNSAIENFFGAPRQQPCGTGEARNPFVNPIPVIEPLFVPLFVPAPPAKDANQGNNEEIKKGSGSSPSNALPSQSAKRVRSHRGGRKNPRKAEDSAQCGHASASSGRRKHR